MPHKYWYFDTCCIFNLVEKRNKNKQHLSCDKAKHFSPKDAAGTLRLCLPGEVFTHTHAIIHSTQTTDIQHNIYSITHSVVSLQTRDHFSVCTPQWALTIPLMNHSCRLNDMSQTWDVLAVFSEAFLESHKSFMTVNRSEWSLRWKEQWGRERRIWRGREVKKLYACPLGKHYKTKPTIPKTLF